MVGDPAGAREDASLTYTDMVVPFVEALARKGPVPAAGAAAAATAAQGAALGQLAVRVSAARLSNPTDPAGVRLRDIDTRLETARVTALDLIDADVEAVRAMFSGDRLSTSGAVGVSSEATRVPLELLTLVAETMEILVEVRREIVPPVRAEVGAAGALLRAAAVSAGLIAQTNANDQEANSGKDDVFARVRGLLTDVDTAFTALWSTSDMEPPAPPAQM